MMDPSDIHSKFGDDYSADQRTFTMGIDLRFTAHFADRVRGRTVLETCTGGGFTTISLAREARQVHTVEIDPAIQAQARHNVEQAGQTDRVDFILGDILDQQLLQRLPPVDAAFLDGTHELFCLYFGDLAAALGETEFHAPPTGGKR